MSHIKTLLVSHFYNEEFLLPFWIKQHIGMFDDVVMIDYNSTDASVEIIKKLAPHWQIRKSRNEYFLIDPTDKEVMDVEKEFDGYWKMALNTTEFIVMPELNLKKFIVDLLEKRPDATCISSRGAWMVDTTENVDKPVDPNAPLYSQRCHGTLGGANRCRVIHKMPHGSYSGGRHNTSLQTVHPKDVFSKDIFYCLWYGWSPYCESLRKRKMQIKTKLHPDDFRQSPFDVYNHAIPDIENLNWRFTMMQNGCYDTLTDPDFNAVVQSCPKFF